MSYTHKVKVTLEDGIRLFVRELERTGRSRFTQADLSAYCRGIVGHSFSPESPARLLRKARHEGIINYACVRPGLLELREWN